MRLPAGVLQFLFPLQPVFGYGTQVMEQQCNIGSWVLLSFPKKCGWNQPQSENTRIKLPSSPLPPYRLHPLHPFLRLLA